MDHRGIPRSLVISLSNNLSNNIPALQPSRLQGKRINNSGLLLQRLLLRSTGRLLLIRLL